MLEDIAKDCSPSGGHSQLAEMKNRAFIEGVLIFRIEGHVMPEPVFSSLDFPKKRGTPSRS